MSSNQIISESKKANSSYNLVNFSNTHCFTVENKEVHHNSNVFKRKWSKYI